MAVGKLSQIPISVVVVKPTQIDILSATISRFLWVKPAVAIISTPDTRICPRTIIIMPPIIGLGTELMNRAIGGKNPARIRMRPPTLAALRLMTFKLGNIRFLRPSSLICHSPVARVYDGRE